MTVKHNVFVELFDVVMAYTYGMIDKYGWPPRWGGTLKEMYAGVVDFDVHDKVSYHAPFLLGLRPVDMSQLGVWSIYSKPDMRLVYMTTVKPDGLEDVVVRRWLKSNGFPPMALKLFNNDGEKADYLLHYAKYLDVIIDTRKEILVPLYKRGAPLTVVVDAPWNRSFEVHRRVNGWRELHTWFMENEWSSIMDEIREKE